MGACPRGSRLLTCAMDRKWRIGAEKRGEERLRTESVEDGVLRAESVFRSVTEYVVSGAADGDRAIVIEHPRLSGWTATVTGGDREDTPSHIRISVKVPAGGKASVMEIGRAPSELQSLMRISYAVFCLKKKKKVHTNQSRN